MAPFLSYHPFKGLATLLLTACAPPYLLTLSVYYLLPRNRPNPNWSFRTAISSAWLNFFFRYATAIRMKPGSGSRHLLGDRYVPVQPGPKELYTGVLQSEKIKPAPVAAAWFPQRPPKEEMLECIVVLHFQGGGFVIATDPGKAGVGPSRIMAKISDRPTYALWSQYRLARDEKSRFPAALQDVVTFYNYVLDMGVLAENVIISGESAGGNLVIGLLRYIEETKALPAPRGAVLWSPWVDVSESALAAYKQNPRLHTDFLNMGLLEWGVDAYKPTVRTEESDRYLRPVEQPFSTRTPLVVNVGTSELFYHEIKTFTERMEKVDLNKLEYIEAKDSPHDVLLNMPFTGLIGEAERVVERAGQFFRL